MSRVYLNGEYVLLEEANIHVLDRGFTFGDGVYEVIPVFNKTVFRLGEHLARLENSLQAIYMDNPLDSGQWQAIFDHLIELVEAPDQSIYLQVTRGVTERDHDIDLANAPTVFVMSRPLQGKNLEAGINSLVLLSDQGDYLVAQCFASTSGKAARCQRDYPYQGRPRNRRCGQQCVYH